MAIPTCITAGAFLLVSLLYPYHQYYSTTEHASLLLKALQWILYHSVKTKVLLIICKATHEVATWYPSDFPNSHSPLSLCSSHIDSSAAARTCQACFHFREFDLAVLTLRMFFPLITIWLMPSSFSSKVPYKMRPALTIQFILQLLSLSALPSLGSIFSSCTKHASCTKIPYYLLNMFIVCILPSPP